MNRYPPDRTNHSVSLYIQSYLSVPHEEPPSHEATVKYHPSKYFKYIAVVHSGQHFPYLRILFKPKSYDTSTLQKWQSGHILKLGKAQAQNGHVLQPTSEMIYCSRGHFDLLIQATNFIT